MLLLIAVIALAYFTKSWIPIAVWLAVYLFSTTGRIR